MSFAAERKAIESLFTNAWKLVTTPLPVLYDNTKQSTPTGDYLFFRIVNGDGRQAEIAGDGPVLDRYVGLVQVDILATAGTGHAKAREYADQIAAIFRRKQLTDDAGGNITFQVPSIRVLGTTSADGRFRVVISAPYTRDIRE